MISKNFNKLLEYIALYKTSTSAREVGEEMLESEYRSLHIPERFYYVRPVLLAFIELKHYRDDSGQLKKVTRRLRADNLIKTVHEVIDHVKSLLPVDCNNRDYVAFQLGIIGWMFEDAITTLRCGYSDISCSINTLIDRIGKGLEDKSIKRFNDLYHGIHMLYFLSTLTFFEREGRETAVVRALSITHQPTALRRIRALFEERYGKKWRDKFSEWHLMFQVLYGSASLIASWIFPFINNKLVAYSLGDETEENIKKYFSQSLTLTRPGRQIDIQPTLLGYIIGQYISKVRTGLVDIDLDKLLQDLGKIYCEYASVLSSISSRLEKGIDIVKESQELYIRVLQSVELTMFKTVKDSISSRDAMFDLVIFLVNRCKNIDAIKEFWSKFPETQIFLC